MSTWLASGELLLHIGVHKTGTTAIQGALSQARPALVEQGVQYPGKLPSAFRAAMSIVHPAEHDTDDAVAIPRERWQRLCAQVAKSGADRVVVSSEVFCEASDEVAAQVLTELSARPTKILIGVRPLWQLLASSWQQYVKSGLTTPYNDWLLAVLRGEGESNTPTFWVRNDLPALVERWARRVGTENIGVYLVETNDRTAAFRLWESMLQLSSNTLTENPDHPSNPSLTAEQTEVIRRVNLALAHHIDYRTYRREVRRGAVLELMAHPTGHPVHTPTWALELAHQRSVADLAFLAATHVNSLNELSGLAAPPPAVRHDPLPFDEDKINADAEHIVHHIMMG